MYKIGDCLIHRSAGVCEVINIVEEDFGFGLFKYYILVPYFKVSDASNSNQMMVRVDNARQIRDFVSKEVANSIIEEIPSFESMWINDSKHRKELFSKILSEGDLRSLCQLIRTIYMKKNEYVDLKKTVPITDNTICLNAEKLVYDEFAIVFGMKNPKEAEEFLSSKFKV